jgi:hypothetical protein
MHISLSYLDGFDNDFDKTEQGHAVHSTMASAPSSITPVISHCHSASSCWPSIFCYAVHFSFKEYGLNNAKLN